jgi:hypothetical protein
MTTATATKSKRGSRLTPELQDQITAYYPFIKKTASQARLKYRRSIPEITVEDWLGILTEGSCRIAPCWDPEKGCFGTLLKIGLGNIIKNVLRDYTKPERSKIRGRQSYQEAMDEAPAPGVDILEELVARTDFDEAASLLDEIRADLKRATRFADRLALVRDFLKSCDPDWLQRRPSAEIAALLGVTPAIVMRARGHGYYSPASPETAPESLITADLPQVEAQVKIEPVEALAVPSAAPVVASTPKRYRQRFGLRQPPRRWLVASLRK